MLKQSVLLTNPYYLSCKKSQLLLEPKNNLENNSSQKEVKHLPIEDIGLLLLDSPEITLSSPLIASLLENNCAVVHCNEKHLPIGMTLTLEKNHIHNAIVHMQIATGEVKKKQLWKIIIEQKIKNQGNLLKRLQLPYQEILSLASKVKSGDASNVEAQAAKKYWNILFSDTPSFSRSRTGNYPNNLLNYGYAVLRASCARAMISSGLSLTLGIHHKNKYNAYCLVDDIMEPYRPFIDLIAYNLIKEKNNKDLDNPTKIALVDSLYQDVKIQKKLHPLSNALTFTASSFVKSLELNVEALKLPVFNE